jgi:hypothetical protein
MKKNLNAIAILFTIFCFITTFSGYGQQTKINKNTLQQKISKTGYIRCATTENEKLLQIKNPKRLSRAQFENWLAPIIATQQEKNLTSKTAITIYTIPVVIHVIHDGDAINTSSSHLSENISDAQAASQITVLNQDFRKKSGTPGYGTTGYQLGVDCLINFVLAKQDPYGVLTTGIEHINLGKVDWSEEEIDAIVKPETQWNPNKYLNIWSVKLSSNLLGYGQFPSNSTLSGLNTIGGESLTDGVVINYDALGTNAENDGSFQLNPKYNMGRTTTHEVGHFLGLRHIWGDGDGDEVADSPDCTASDYCSDTPQAGWEHYECGVFDTCKSTTVSENDMTENYMDYTNDACMNTFTAGQKARMVAVMTNSPRRKELQSSTVATPGFTTTLDATLKNILITVSGCNTSFTPSINFENKGTTTIQTLKITYNIDNLNPKTFVWNGSLAQNAYGLISLPEMPLSSGTHQFSATITAVNNLPDLNSLNDSVSKNFTIPSLNQLTGDSSPSVTLTLQCDRDGSETSWALKNSNGATLYSGGPYTDAVSSTKLNSPITANFNLINGECYTFTINDSYGDGINTNGGVGSYSLKDENNIVFASGGTFLFNESTSLSIGTLGNAKFETSNGIFIFPNPTKDTLNIHIPSLFGLPNSFSIGNSLGKTILQKQVTKESDLTIDTSTLGSGVYLITIVKENEKKTLQFIKE